MLHYASSIYNTTYIPRILSSSMWISCHHSAYGVLVGFWSTWHKFELSRKNLKWENERMPPSDHLKARLWAFFLINDWYTKAQHTVGAMSLHPWASSPRCYKKTVWAIHEHQPVSSICPCLLLQFLPTGFCLEFLAHFFHWWTVT